MFGGSFVPIMAAEPRGPTQNGEPDSSAPPVSRFLRHSSNSSIAGTPQTTPPTSSSSLNDIGSARKDSGSSLDQSGSSRNYAESHPSISVEYIPIPLPKEQETEKEKGKEKASVKEIEAERETEAKKEAEGEAEREGENLAVLEETPEGPPESIFSRLTPPMPMSIEFRDLRYFFKVPVKPKNIFERAVIIGRAFIPFVPPKTANREVLKGTNFLSLLFLSLSLSYTSLTQILQFHSKGINGEVRPGQFLAIMGPSGCGKTTLLNILAQRTKRHVSGISLPPPNHRKTIPRLLKYFLIFDTGTLLVNGHKPDSFYKRQVAYVLQDDVFFANLTVKQTIAINSILKLPSKSVSLKEKFKRVNELIKEFGLTKARNTIIGGPFRRGVSGGERKRTNIANEMVMNPSLLFLDEPTSG